MAITQAERVQKHLLPPREHLHLLTQNTRAKDSSARSRCRDGGRKIYFKLRQINFCEFQAQPLFSVSTHTWLLPFPQPHEPGNTVQQLLYHKTKDFTDSLCGGQESAEIHTEIQKNERSICINFPPPQSSFLQALAVRPSGSNS